MEIKIIFPVLILFSVTGCAGVNYVLENYSNVKHVIHHVKPNDGKPDIIELNGKLFDRTRTYWVFDKPSENRLMITASASDSAAQGFAEGLTFGVIDHSPPIVQYENAAADYLKSIGKNCSITKSFLIVKPQYEMQYSCK